MIEERDIKAEKAIFNWLQMDIVYKGRPKDNIAKETVTFFKEILKEDHGITDLEYELDLMMYNVSYSQNGEKKTVQFLKSITDQLLEEIESEPRYN